MTDIIKASRVAHLTDARYFAAREVSFLGFNLEEGTEGYLDPIYMKAIREWVEGPRFVGEFTNTPIRTVREAAVFYGLDTVQVSALKHGADLSLLEGLEIILEIEVDEQGLPISKATLEEMAPHAHYFLFNFPADTFSKLNFWAEKSYWQAIFSLRPSLIQAEIPANKISSFLQEFGLAGISVVGGEEEQVGVKSFDEIESVFEALGR